MEAAGSSETLVVVYQTTWRHISQDNNLNGEVRQRNQERTRRDWQPCTNEKVHLLHISSVNMKSDP
jgi:hypothetical protein